MHKPFSDISLTGVDEADCLLEVLSAVGEALGKIPDRATGVGGNFLNIRM